LGFKNEDRYGPLKRGLFLPVLYLFEGRSALKRVVIEVVFLGGWKNWVYYPIFEFYGVGSDDTSIEPFNGIFNFNSYLITVPFSRSLLKKRYEVSYLKHYSSHNF